MSYTSKEPFVLIIFGGSGDLSYQKIYPALYDIAEKGHFPKDYAIIATGRRYTQQEFHGFFEHSLTSDNRHHKHSVTSDVFKEMQKHIFFYQSDITDPASYKGLNDYLNSLFAQGLPCNNRVFYVGVPQFIYKTIFSNLKSSGLYKSPKGWTRVIVEKPIGDNLKSAKSLEKIFLSAFNENQIYRLDHYLGKDTLENVMTFRFENPLFENMINNKFLDHIQITAAEDFGIKNRAKFYEATGALKDVGQNHLLQMVALATMEQPKGKSEKAMHAARIKLLNSLKAKASDIVFGQYTKGQNTDEIGYREEEGVASKSEVDTFFALKATINNPRFEGVPVYIRGGKKLPRWVTEINYIFKGKKGVQNVLTVRLQPNPGIAVRFITKKPGIELETEPVLMQFCDKHSFPDVSFDAYEKLIQEVFAGRHSFFNTAKEVEALWKFIDPISKKRSKVKFYKSGSWGPKEAFDLLKKDGREWIEPYTEMCAI